MNRFSYFVLVGLGAAVIGCGTETGILIEVTLAPGLEETSFDQLEVYVGTADSNGNFVRQKDMGDLIDVSDRDLASDPYALMLRPGEGLEGKIMVAVAARVDGAVTAFGGLPEPAVFSDGEVLHWEIVLEPIPSDGVRPVTPTGCATWDQNNIGAPEDPDCDGYTTEEEGEACARDPWLNPDAMEVCDNVDNNCDGHCDDVDADEDGVYACATECVRDEGEGGDCDDNDETVHPGADELCDGIDKNCSSGGGPAGACGVFVQGVCVKGEKHCGNALTVCGPIEPLTTVDDQNFCPTQDTACTLQVFVAQPEPCPGTERLGPLTGGATKCEWEIINDGGYEVGFVSEGTGSGTEVCDATLEVQPGPESQAEGMITLQLTTDAGIVTHYLRILTDPADEGVCPANPDEILTCQFN